LREEYRRKNFRKAKKFPFVILRGTLRLEESGFRHRKRSNRARTASQILQSPRLHQDDNAFVLDNFKKAVLSNPDLLRFFCRSFQKTTTD
jgi:adenine-specific DNA methylase